MMFNSKIEPSCEYCRFGSILDNEHLICLKRGIISSDSTCRRFKYDPLKRKPSIPNNFSVQDFSKEDFSL